MHSVTKRAAIKARSAAQHGKSVHVLAINQATAEIEFDIDELGEGDEEGGPLVLAQELHQNRRLHRALLVEQGDMILGGLEVIGQRAVGGRQVVPAGFEGGFEFRRRDAVELAHDLAAQVALDFEIDIVEQVERYVCVAHKRARAGTGLDFGALGDPLDRSGGSILAVRFSSSEATTRSSPLATSALETFSPMSGRLETASMWSWDFSLMTSRMSASVSAFERSITGRATSMTSMARRRAVRCTGTLLVGDLLGEFDADLRFEVSGDSSRRSRRTASDSRSERSGGSARNTSVIWRSSSRRFSLEPSLASSSNIAKLLAGDRHAGSPLGQDPETNLLAVKK